MEVIHVDSTTAQDESLRSEGEQATSHTGAMQVLSPPPLIMSLARQEQEDIYVPDRSFVWTRLVDMLVNEPREAFLMNFLSEKDPHMDHSNLWPLVEREMTYG